MALGRSEPPRVIMSELSGTQDVRGVFQRTVLTPIFQQSIILLSFLALPDALFSFGMIGIVVILMDRANVSGKVHDRNFRIYCKPEEPGVPAGTADDKLGNLMVIKAPGKDEIIHPLWRPSAIGLEGKPPNRLFPGGLREVHRS